MIWGRMLVELGLSRVADRIYRTLIRKPDAELAEIAATAQVSPDDAAVAVEELIVSGLLIRSWERPFGVVVIDPEIAVNRLLAARTAELAQQQEKLSTARASLHTVIIDYISAAGRSHPTSDILELVGVDAIRGAVEEWEFRAQHEVLVMTPIGFGSADQLTVTRDFELKVLERGIRLRSLQTMSSRNNPAMARHYDEVARLGGHIRFAGVIPMRMHVFDRQAGLIPMHPADNGRSAILLRGEALTATLVLSFEQIWASAEPLAAASGIRAEQYEGLAPSDLDRRLLKLMSLGAKDEAIGRQLGVSVRTVRRQIADLMARLDANSRFEAGVQAAFRGWIQPADWRATFTAESPDNVRI